MGNIGYVALILALVASLYSTIAYMLEAAGRRQSSSYGARASLLVTAGLVSFSAAVLLYALLAHDFSLEYVAAYSSRDTSLAYLVSAFWAGNDGSLLFWAWILSLLAVVLALRRWDAGKDYVPYASAVVMFTEAFFLVMLVSVSNPFQALPVPPPDGTGLNPLLENPGMIFHPPALLAGYVGFTIPFALAVAGLITRRLSSDWLTVVRRWTLLAWLLLGVGNIIGAWWAYVELGWGGYWAWDPVENAGLMPWLAATAFLHSTMAQRRKGMLKVWSMVLMILTFDLAIFGTFLTRSGILSSVHSFGDLGLGPFFLVFIGITLFGALGLLYLRRSELKDDGEIESFVSREGTILLNNLLLVGSVAAIFLGTIFPAISEAVRGDKITVGTSFFNLVNAPLFLVIILLAGICTRIGWQRQSTGSLLRSLLWPLLPALAVTLLLFILGVRDWNALAAFFACSFVLALILYQWLQNTRARHRARSESYLSAFWALLRSNRPRYGGYLVHIAIVLMAIGVAGSSIYSVEKDVSLKMGESMSIKNYTLTYDDMGHSGTPSKFLVTATLSVSNSGKSLGQLMPQKYFHQNFEQPVTEVAIRSTPLEDLYVILVGWDASGATAFKVLVNPLVIWIWVGGGIFLLGGLIAFWPQRRRLAVAALEDKGVEGPKPPAEGGFCTRCGARYRAGDRFCARCGAKLRKE